MRFPILAAAVLCSSFASANPLDPRQAASTSSTSTPATVSASSSVLSTSSSSSSTAAAAPSSASSDTGVPVSISFTSPATSNSASGTSAAATATSTPSGGCTQQQAQAAYDQNGYTGPVALCGVDGGNNTLFQGDKKFIQWWPGAFPKPGANVDIILRTTDAAQNVKWNDSLIPAFRGSSLLYVDPVLIPDGKRSEYRLVLRESEPELGVVNESDGPILVFLVPSTTPPPAAPTSFNLLGVAVGLPVALAVIAGVLLVFCCVTKKHRSIFSKIRLPTRRRGYGVRQSRRQRTGNAVDEFDFDASAAIYRDEPGEDYAASTRDERSARAMGVFSAERNLHSTY